MISSTSSCRTAGIDVLLDDRPLRPGVMFNDMELIGIPHQVVIGDALDQDEVEYRERGCDSVNLPQSDCVSMIRDKLAN